MHSPMTYFDSKRYLSFKKFQDFHLIRKKHLPILPEQETEYERMFQQQSIRYTFQVQSTWIEETFESMDGNYLTFYHDDAKKAHVALFLEETLHFFDYDFGAVGVLENVEQAIVDRLTQSDLFTYELDTIVYRCAEIECYITVHILPRNNFALKIFEKDTYDTTVKETLIDLINKQLQPILLSHNDGQTEE